MTPPDSTALFAPVLAAGEYPLWLGKPRFLAFMLVGLPFFLFGLVWLAFDYYAFLRELPAKGYKHVVVLGFIAVHLLPFWASLYNLASLAVSYPNTWYTCTDRRFILRSGAFGTDFRSIYFDRLDDVVVDVNPFEKLLGVGTIRLYTGGTDKRGNRIYESLLCLPEPYQALRALQPALEASRRR